MQTKELRPFQEDDYIETWNNLESQCIENGFSWAALWENEEWNQYITPSLYEISGKQWNAVQIASYRIGQIFQSSFQYIQRHLETHDTLHIPKRLQPLMHISQTIFSYFARMDLVVKGENIKLLEMNADTPVGMVESSVGNRLICDLFETSSPNTLETEASRTWKDILFNYHIPSSESLFFLSYGCHEEDTKTVEWMMKQCPHEKKVYVSAEDLVVNKNGVYTKYGREIRYLYRLLPLEYLLEESYGEQLLTHIEKGNLQLINPPATFLTQSKALLAWIWEQKENSKVFSTEEQEWIVSYFLPTYFSPSVFERENKPYVAKPIWGREGGGIEIIDGKESLQDITAYYANQPKIYQSYEELPSVTVGTWDGPYEGRFLIGSHLMNGVPSGLFLRAGEKITGNLSMCFGVSKQQENM